MAIPVRLKAGALISQHPMRRGCAKDTWWMGLPRLLPIGVTLPDQEADLNRAYGRHNHQPKHPALGLPRCFVQVHLRHSNSGGYLGYLEPRTHTYSNRNRRIAIRSEHLICANAT